MTARASLVALALVALLVSCGAPPETPSTEATTGADDDESAASNGGRDRNATDIVVGDSVADDTTTPSRPPCPAAFGADPPTCDGSDNPGLCTYPEGDCSCSEPRWCGGAAPLPMPYEWRCESPPPPCPPAGSACTPPGHCSSNPCGWGGGVSCIDGVWTPHMTPPPP